MTFKQFKADTEKAISELGNPIYCHKPYVLLKDGVIMSAGTVAHFTIGTDGLDEVIFSSTYYDDCEFKLREYNLHMNDNRKATLPLFI